MLSSDNDLRLTAYCDADWAACPLTRRSLSGYIIMLGDYVDSWKTKKQHMVAHSSAEAEYRSMAYTYQELKWMNELLSTLNIHQSGPMPFYCDNQAALHIAHNPVFHGRTKHIEADCHFVRDAVQAGIIDTKHVKTTDQIADILTKSLSRQEIRYLLGKMGIRNLHAPP